METLRKKRESTLSKPFQQLLNISQAAADPLACGRTFQVRKQRSQSKPVRPYFQKPIFCEEIAHKIEECRPWSREKY